ncbi:MAG: VWA domain-containing protein, partial [Spirochaetaceae bacterium]
MNTKTTLIILVLFLMSLSLFAEAMAESSASSTRGKYLAGQGIIIPPEEIYPESYIAQVNYEYPFPSKEIGISLYSGTRTVSARGEENLLHIGIQGRKIDFPDLPPLNLVFVIDCSSSMSEKNKLEWIKESCGIFINKVRDTDFVSLVVFNDTPEVLIPSVQMNTAEKRKQFLDTVLELTTMGGTDIKAALETAYSQVMANVRQNYVNRVIFISDGTDFSDRLVSANAKSGEIRMSLLWNNRNDLDLHVVPPSSEEIFYGNKKSLCGGELDVDMNVEGETTKPIENIYWLSGRAPRGRYRVYVQNYDYHENVRGKTSFTVELKRRNEVTYFEGEISGSGKSSNVPVFEFNFNPEDSGNNSGQYEIVERYNKMGINISTIGVGTKFDVELMRNLAHRGGGSSRFISDHDEMVEIFDTEFDRMVAPAARNVKIKLTFPEKTQILGTWGYDNSVRGSSVDYFIPTLHNRDYETILVRMRTPQGAKTGENTFATVSVSYETLNGKTITLDPTDISCTVVDHEIATSGYSNTMVLHSGTMLHLAETLKTIGNKYYSYQDELLKLQQQRNQPREALFERGKKIAEECLQLAFDEKKL